MDSQSVLQSQSSPSSPSSPTNMTNSYDYHLNINDIIFGPIIGKGAFSEGSTTFNYILKFYYKYHYHDHHHYHNVLSLQ